MGKLARSIVKFLLVSLAIVAISQGGLVSAATLPVATLQTPVEQGLRTPTNLAVAQDGSLYVVDPANQGVLKYNSAGVLLQKIVVPGIPQGIAVTSTGNLLVSQREFVALYDTNGSELKRLGSGKGQFISAAGIALDESGFIYVADSKGRCVQVFDAGGVYLTRFGVSGSGAGQFMYPTAIAYEKLSKQIAVVDSLNARVLFFDKSGAFVRAIGGNGTGPLKFMHPQGLAFEYYGATSVRMYVCDAMLKNIQAIDPAGTGVFLSYVKAGKGTQHGSPSALAFDGGTKRLYVVDGLGGITVYKISNGTVVVDIVAPAATSATLIASSALPIKKDAVTLSNQGTVAPLNLSMVADGSTVDSDIIDITGITTNISSVTVNTIPVAITNDFFTVAVPLVAGANTITVTATDRAGKTWSEVRTVTKSTGLPVLTMSTPDVQTTDLSTVTLSGSVDKDTFVSVAGISADLSAQLWTAQVSLNPGLNTVQVQAINLNGQAVTQKRTFIYNQTAPSLAITSPAEDSIVTAAGRIVISGTVSTSTSTTVTAHVNGKAVTVASSSGSFTFPVDFTAEGVYTLTVSAVTANGSSTIGRSILYQNTK